MSQLLETGMLIFFGISWPINIIKAIKVRTTKGVSIFFLYFILIGYFCGIAAKFVAGHINYVVGFYILNFIMVSIDILLYYRNSAIEHLESQKT